MLTTDTTEFRNRFTKENDANNRYNYLTTLKEISSKVVSGQKQTNQKNWKEVIYYQLMDVQSLKIRFGTIAFKISENIARYKNLIIKYKNDTHIGPRVVSLESKLTNLKETFDRAFEPMEYINSATRMYKVN